MQLFYLYAVCKYSEKKLLQVCLTVSSVATAMHWAPIQIVMPITKSMMFILPTSAETRIFSMIVCPDYARALVDWHHFGTSLLYFAFLKLLL